MSSSDTISRRPSGMRVFIMIALALHVPLFVYPVLRLGSWFELSPWLTALILLPVVSSQTISRTLLRNAVHPAKRFARHVADFVLGVSPILLMALLIAEALVAFSLLAPLAAGQLTLLVTAGIAAFGLVMAITPMVKTISLQSGHLKARLRFVQITDVHIGSRNRAFLERIVSRINAVDPDFVCITGDFIDASGVSVETISPLSRLSCPVFFSLGNHERYEDLPDIIKRLESLGVEVLRTRSRDFRDDVQVIGIDDRDDALQVQRELGRLQVAGEKFTLLMYHRPRGLEAAAAAGVDLMISGHTHNGQIFPFNLVVNRVFDQVEGLYKSGSAHLYVSQGTGTWGPVMRVGTRSEITLFDITPEKPLMSIDAFREETRAWLEENCPPSMRTAMPADESPGGGSKIVYRNPDTKKWLDACAAKGFTAPTWPTAYGGAGLDVEQARVLRQEMSRINARPPLVGMGLSMIGPALLEFGTDEQKAEHLPKIATGEVWWCQGYSEPNAGSDLASLQTRAVLDGDEYIINGQKIWTSGADMADWIFCLVRTDTKASKHNGITFILFEMDQPGVSVKPIKLISGLSPFCETFFEDARALRRNVVGNVNEGWTVAKRLVQHEMNNRAYGLTMRRSTEESKSTQAPSFVSSMFKLYGTEQNKNKYELMLRAMGAQMLGLPD